MHLSAALRAAPPLLLFNDPFFRADLMHMFQVLYGLGMVSHPVVVKISNQITGKIRAIPATFDSGPFRCALPHLAIPAIGCEGAAAKASVALRLAFRQFPCF
jgi:hypothetical protein